jgi:ferric-dicitrate binding protein FerR (iron transport regulator)
MSSTTEHYEKLLAKYFDGQCNAAETAELYTWLQASGSHRALLKTMQEEFKNAFSTQQEIPAEISDRIETKLLQSITEAKPKTKIHTLWYYAAASVAAAIILLLTLKQPTPELANKPVTAAASITPGTNKAVLTLSNGSTVILDSAGNQIISQGATTVLQKNGQLQYASKASSEEATVYNTLTVPRGGQFNIILPDGSHVWLNAASSLRYPTSFNGKDRRVDITGQGYFEVTPNAKQPFIVQVNNMEVQVLGTAFDVMAYADEKSVNTTLIQGAVKVNDKRLFPGQQALMDPATGDITIRQADVEQVIAWKTGFFEFDNARLSDILRQLSRWYDIDINYKQTTNERLLGGRISRSLPLSDILHMLEANGPVFELAGRKLTVK